MLVVSLIASHACEAASVCGAGGAGLGGEVNVVTVAVR